jgi:hypothetical protein
MDHLVGFTGSRRLGPRWAPAVSAVVSAVVAGGGHPVVGDAHGADALVRDAAPDAIVFYAEGRRPYQLIRRSVRMVKAVRENPAPPAFPSLYAFPTQVCPRGIVPGPRWSSGRPSSGTWSTAALAVGLGLTISVVWCSLAQPPTLPAWPGGAWARAWAPAGLARPVQAFTWEPGAARPAHQQLTLTYQS